ncbi:MAG: CsgG/HfaB family protein, partial [candidate division Zixibacteria bacterium]
MNRLPKFSGGKCACFVLILTFSGMTTPVFGQTVQSAVYDRIQEALDLYLRGKPDDAIKLAESLFEQTELSPADSIAVLECLSVCNFAKGVQYQVKALEYLDRIVAIGPCINSLPRKFWPSQLADKWYGLLRSQDIYKCESHNSGKYQTIAFMPFENNSIGEYQESLGRLSHAIAEFMCVDFEAYTGLKIVERRKVSFLLEEHEMTNSDLMDPAQAIKTGKITGAQLMVIGSITQLG